MSFPGGSDQSPGDDATPSHNPPWPIVDPFTQGKVERKYLADGVTIDFNKIPQLQFWASWFGVGETFRVMSVLRRVAAHSSGARRRLTEPEVDAICEYAATSTRAFAWAQPVALGLVAAITASGAKNFQFPLYKPKMVKFDPFVFPSKRFPFLRGPRAAGLWHVVRIACYIPVVWVPTAAFYSSYADSTFHAHIVKDPRLSRVIDDIRRNALGDLQAAKAEARRGPAPQFPMQNQPPISQRSKDNTYGDPTPQEYGNTDADSAPSSWTSSTPIAPAPRRTGTNSQPSSNSRHDDDDLDLFDDDDASPVAPSARRSESRQRPSGPPGSSWDRLRQQAKSDGSMWEKGDSSGQEQGWAQLRQDKTRNPKDANPKTEGYAYSKDEEEREARNYEKEKAQKEFDAMLEAERRGEGASGGNGGGWRKR
ncbi:hypothetical protein GGS20DRAFT_215891 [Poronia punctata]|nr:hypothetical protein GGS20DRAFT_215891 [Poronia punctata]